MSRIRELTSEGASQLRLQVRQRFARGHSNENGFRPSTFKGAYEDLRDDIIKSVPGAEFSVSLIRLRKLFYYTDSTICPPDQLEKPSFGRDFVEALEKYVGLEKAEQAHFVKPPTTNYRWIVGLLLLILFAISGLLLCFFGPQTPKNWREDFDDTRVETLRERGFEWSDFDAAWWPKQKQEGFLTLHTLRGDYWIKPHEQRVIKNLLYRKVKGDCFTIIAKVDGFNPQKNCQQFTVFLFDERLSRETHLRAGISFWSPSEDNPGVQHTTTDYQEYGQVTQMGYYHFRNPANEGHPVKTFWLKIVYKDEKIEVLQKINNDWNIWAVCARPFDLRFKPAYVGIAAFQGWTNDDGSPRDAEPIPVLVDYLQVESCD